MESRTFFSLLEEKLLYLGLNEQRARAEISAFRAKMKNNPRFDLFVARAGEPEVAQTAERLYAGIIVRANAPLRGKEDPAPETVNVYTDDISLPDAPPEHTSDTLERPASPSAPETPETEDDFSINQKPDYIGLLCQRLKRSFDRTPAARLWLVLLVPLVLLAVSLAVLAFCSLRLFLSLLLIFFLLLTCAVAVGGTAAALAGIIYGVIKLFTGYAPIGWYEIGISVTVIGMTIFSGIVFYNCALRVLPMVVRQTGHWMKHFFLQLGDDLKTAKGVFAKK